MGTDVKLHSGRIWTFFLAKACACRHANEQQVGGWFSEDCTMVFNCHVCSALFSDSPCLILCLMSPF